MNRHVTKGVGTPKLWERIASVWQITGIVAFIILEICIPIVYFLLVLYFKKFFL